MKTVTIIATEHVESGMCNSDELVKIMAALNPEVIFEEDPDDEHYRFLYQNPECINSLEKKAIIKYKTLKSVLHIPVDKPLNKRVSVDLLDNLSSFFSNSHMRQKALNQHSTLRDLYGFNYLNSNACLSLLNSINLMEDALISKNNRPDNNLGYLHSLFKSELQARELAMVENIYAYSEQSNYEQAIFFIGFRHIPSLIANIEKQSSLHGNSISWKLYNG